ncbi:MAG: copper-translocating P-type ATPase [Vampirovibrionales bacterium]|nr:copper-translocating P-type ATPase [Vampirovibrionales bacterium]
MGPQSSFPTQPDAQSDVRKTEQASPCCAGHSMGSHPQKAKSQKQAGGDYTCPMHPEVRKEKPGACPKCGMALESDATGLDDGADGAEEDLELRQMSSRFWICLTLTLPLFLISMGPMLLVPLGLLDVASSVSHQSHTSPFLAFALATPVVLWGAWPFFQRGWDSLVNLSLNMFTLISLGVGIAYGYSVFALLFFDGENSAQPFQMGLYFETAAVITTLVLLGQMLELKARGKTGGAIRALLDMSAKTAILLSEDGSESEVLIDEIAVGDRLRVKPGAKIPVDGVVLEGASTVDESMMSGEAMPVQKQPSDAVTGGTINQGGALLIEARRVGQETVLSQMVELVRQAQRSQAPVQRMADKIASYFVPFVLGVSLLTFAFWMWGAPADWLPLSSQYGRVGFALLNAIAVLIIACPCALGLATPMSIMVATGLGAKHGILFKNAEAIESLEGIDTLVMDKTGTITEGKPSLVSVLPAAGFSETTLLQVAASLEHNSEHPLAHAILEGARQKELSLLPLSEFTSETGQGVSGKVDGKDVRLGALAYIEQAVAGTENFENLAHQVQAAQSRGETVIFCAIDNAFSGLLSVADPIKANAKKALEALRQQGLSLAMATGDNQTTAQAVADQLGLGRIYAGVLPEEKAALIQRLQAEGKQVALAGDGVNDAPALAQAQVGIAMGNGADIAIESADVALLKGDLWGIVKARQLSRSTLKNIRQNLLFAFLYNGLAIPLAAGVLYPGFGILLNPMIAALAMSLSSVSIILNALRLYRVQFSQP